MESVLQFFGSALPWLMLGLALAIGIVALDERRKSGNSLAALTVALLLLGGSTLYFATAPQPAFAAETKAESAIKVSDDVFFTFGDDVLWAGSNMRLNGTAVGNDVIGCGQNLSVSNTTVPGSIRLAGQIVSIRDVNVGHSVTLAGQDIVFTGGSAQAVACVGQTVLYDGTANSLYAAAQDVTIDGVVNGDVYVSASTLRIGEHAVINGTVSATLGKDPDVSTTATLGALDYSIDEQLANDNVSKADIFAAFLASGITIPFLMIFLIGSILGVLIIALVCEWLGRKHTAESASMAKNRTAIMLGTGAIGGMVAPIVLIALCCMIVTLPLAGVLVLALLAVAAIAEGFVAASLAQIVWPNMGRWQRVMLMALIVGAASALPLIGFFVSLAASVYLLGYILQHIYLTLQAEKAAPAPTYNAPEAADAAVPTEDV